MGVGAAVIGGIGGIAKTITGANQASDARKAIENYQRQELENAYEGLSVSTLGADLQREEMARATATGVEALRSGGTRALVGGLGRVQEGVNIQSREIASDLDRQQKQIDYARAADDARIRDMQERREERDLEALSSQYNAGQQTMFSGIGDIAQIAGAAGGLMGGGASGASRGVATSVGSPEAKGFSSMINPNFSNPFITN